MLWRTAVVAVLLAVAASGCRHLNGDAEQPPAKKEQVQENKTAVPAAADEQKPLGPQTSPDPNIKDEARSEEASKGAADQPASEEKTEEGAKSSSGGDEQK